MIRADVVDDRIGAMSVYCTGDWDEAEHREHADAVQLERARMGRGWPRRTTE